MKKQKIRFYAALLCSSMVFSLVSTPVSAAETEQMPNPQTSTEGPGSPESTSGNEAAAVLNGLYTALPIANGEAEVTTAQELTSALADSSISRITLKGNIDIGSTLTVNRTVKHISLVYTGIYTICQSEVSSCAVVTLSASPPLWNPAVLCTVRFPPPPQEPLQLHSFPMYFFW